MFQFLRFIAASDLFLRQLPVFVLSLLIADRWYKFHSFLLETGAFLASWFVIDAVVQGVIVLRRRVTGERSVV
jgi:hypothetical protein